MIGFRCNQHQAALLQRSGIPAGPRSRCGPIECGAIVSGNGLPSRPQRAPAQIKRENITWLRGLVRGGPSSISIKRVGHTELKGVRISSLGHPSSDGQNRIDEGVRCFPRQVVAAVHDAVLMAGGEHHGMARRPSGL